MFREGGVLLEKLDDAIGQLGVVQRQTADLVQRDEDLQGRKKLNVNFLRPSFSLVK